MRYLAAWALTALAVVLGHYVLVAAGEVRTGYRLAARARRGVAS